jgi:hypothetical protein
MDHLFGIGESDWQFICIQAKQKVSKCKLGAAFTPRAMASDQLLISRIWDVCLLMCLRAFSASLEQRTHWHLRRSPTAWSSLHLRFAAAHLVVEAAVALDIARCTESISSRACLAMFRFWRPAQ